MTTRRSAKTIEASRRFALGLKPRHRTFSAVTLATFAAAVILVVSPFKLFPALPPRVVEGVMATRMTVSLDKLPLALQGAAPDNSLKEAAVATSDIQPITAGPPGKCLKHVLYDKPVKTGSTAITNAIRNYLEEHNRRDKICGSQGPLNCRERAVSICNGTYPESDYFSIIGHFRQGGRELVDCLRPNYYVVTSIREPYQRRKSAYLWNRTLNGSHFGIPHTLPFAEFMERLPRCQLYDYYDGLGMECGDAGVSLEQRIQDIVDRTDEVIDLYDEAVGPLHLLISKFVERANESIKVEEEEYVEEFNKDTLREEQMLYERLREKRLSHPDVNRLPC